MMTGGTRGKPLLRADRISLTYGDVPIIRDLSMAVYPQECVAVMAPSGSGKTTLLRLLLGLEPTSSGDVAIELTTTQVGVVFQEDNLFPWMSVEANASVLGELTGKGPLAERAEEYLGLFGLGEYGQQLPGLLSAGMKQRLGICRVLVAQPRLYVIDEGLSSMDDLLRYRVCDILRSHVLDAGATLLVVTHNPTDALHLADRVLVGSDRPLMLKETFLNPLPRDRTSDIRFTEPFRLAVRDLRDVQGRS